MLREGWDVQNVTVVVGLRPYTAKANILPEQTIGRGTACRIPTLRCRRAASRSSPTRLPESGPDTEQRRAMLTVSVQEYDIADVRPVFGKEAE